MLTNQPARKPPPGCRHKPARETAHLRPPTGKPTSARGRRCAPSRRYPLPCGQQKVATGFLKGHRQARKPVAQHIHCPGRAETRPNPVSPKGLFPPFCKPHKPRGLQNVKKRTGRPGKENKSPRNAFLKALCLQSPSPVHSYGYGASATAVATVCIRRSRSTS